MAEYRLTYRGNIKTLKYAGVLTVLGGAEAEITTFEDVPYKDMILLVHEAMHRNNPDGPPSVLLMERPDTDNRVSSTFSVAKSVIDQIYADADLAAVFLSPTRVVRVRQTSDSFRIR